MRYTPMFALGAFFAVVGIALFVLAFFGPKKKDSGLPPKKKELREQEERRTESGKLRLAGLLFTIFGIALMLLS
jgi:hypothetical protein